MNEQTTIVIKKGTRDLISHMKYEFKEKTYDDTIRRLIEYRKGSEKFAALMRFMGVE